MIAPPKSKIKLTGSQLELLQECAKEPQNVVSYYRPASSLVKKGLCEWKDNGTCEQLFITEEGREFLK